MVDQKALRDVLPEVDALIISCPLTEETRLMIDAPEIAAMKPGIVVINVARGGVVNEPVMIDALRSGRIKAPRSTCSRSSRFRSIARCGNCQTC